jgi:hypothetical protein
MEKIKKIVETTLIDELGNETKNTYKTLLTYKNWNELTREEKEKEIEKHYESIYTEYQDYVYEGFKAEIECIKELYKNIEFDDIYTDSNSQGWWVDRICGFKYLADDIEIFGETITIYDIDFKIRRLIEDFEICLYDYYIDDKKMEKIRNTKKFKEWENKIKADIENWVDEINRACVYLGNAEYHTPYNLDDVDDRDFIENYFSDTEFVFTEEIGDE